MNMTATEKIRLIAKRKGIGLGEIAEATNQSRQNFSNKMQRDNFTVLELENIAKALNCTINVVFHDNETGEEI